MGRRVGKWGMGKGEENRRGEGRRDVMGEARRL